MDFSGLDCGFLPESEPLVRLPNIFKPWEFIIDDLPSLIKERKLRDKVQRLPLLTVSDTSLTTKQHWQRACCVLTYISQGYIWEGGEDDMCDSLPKQLAIPLSDVSSNLGLPPSPCYAHFCLWNWCLKNPSEPPSADNFKCPLSFTGTEDEEWFYLIHIRIELAAVPGIKAINACIEAMKRNDKQEVMQCLNTIAECISSITSILKEMRLKCNPDVFFNKIQQYFAGHPTGIKYEGTDCPDTVRKCVSASAIQSSVIPLFTVFLGINIQSDVRAYLDKMRWHMPREHRQFLYEMKEKVHLREHVQLHSSNKEMTAAYNRCIKELTGFRQAHIGIMTSYIIIPSHAQSATGSTALGESISGSCTGSDLMNFLRKPRDETAAHKLTE